jgi:arsenite-transporting ATPase
MQERYLRQIDETFGGEVLTSVPEFERDITGLEMIGKVADALFGSTELGDVGGGV